MKYNPNIHHRQSIRLRGYDYSQPGAYFVTICTHNRECCLGEIINGEMKFTVRGKIAYQFWFQITEHFPNVELDEFIIMPNHIHAIIIITNPRRGGVSPPTPANDITDPRRGGVSPPTPANNSSQANTPPTPTNNSSPKKTTLGQIIAYYKYQTTKMINQIDHSPKNRLWQRNYYDRIIRNQNLIPLIQQYIVTNPIRWAKDPHNPRRGGVSPPTPTNNSSQANISPPTPPNIYP